MAPRSKTQIIENETETATAAATQALAKTDPGDTPIEDLELVDRELALQFGAEFEAIANEIQMGFGNMVAAGEIARSGRQFFVINGAQTTFINKKSGEEEIKQVFQLQFPDRSVAVVMQSDANIRAKYARLFTTARLARKACVIGPMRYIEKGQPVAGNMPVIFEQLPGFKIVAKVPDTFFEEQTATSAA